MPSRNVILGAVHRLRTDEIAAFSNSLRATGFDGDIVLYCGETDAEFKTHCASVGARSIPFRFFRLLDGPINAARFRAFRDFLRNHGHLYESVLISDVRDVVFQADPFPLAVGDRCHFFLESDRYTIGKDPYHIKWAQRFIARRHRASLLDKRISCVGVSLGRSDSMESYLTRLWALVGSANLWHRGRPSADQIFHNYMIHLEQSVPYVLHENNDIVATMGLEGREAYHLGEHGLIKCADGSVPAVCHQYDRFEDISSSVRKRFATAAMAAAS